MMNMVANFTHYTDFEPNLENGIHGLIHMFVGFSMTVMISPDDPLFFLHHCNIDRLFHLWIDCHGYDNITSANLTSTQYAGSPTTRDNPQPGLPDYTFTLSSQMPYYWGGTGSSTAFPKKMVHGQLLEMYGLLVSQVHPVMMECTIDMDQINWFVDFGVPAQTKTGLLLIQDMFQPRNEMKEYIR